MTTPTDRDLLAAIDRLNGRQQVAEVLDHAARACLDAALAGWACAGSAATAPPSTTRDRVIELNEACAELAVAAARTLARSAGDDPYLLAIVERCAAACGSCAQACAPHAATHTKCAASEAASTRAEQACRAVLDHRDRVGPASRGRYELVPKVPAPKSAKPPVRHKRRRLIRLGR